MQKSSSKMQQQQKAHKEHLVEVFKEKTNSNNKWMGHSSEFIAACRSV